MTHGSCDLLRYFSLQATNPLGFGDSVRMEIESNICREGGPLPDCFNTPLRQAWTTMEKVGYIATKLFYKSVKRNDEGGSLVLGIKILLKFTCFLNLRFTC